MRIAVTTCCVLAMLVAAGCRNSRGELVEAELRTKERMLRETREELERSRLINESLEKEFLRRQQGLTPSRDNSGLLSPKNIEIGSGTGGIDEDRLPGDEALMVVVVPRDEDGNPVRILGVLTVTAWEILPGGTKSPLNSWEINADSLRKTWRQGLLGSGYFVTLNWKKLPTQQRLRIAAQLTLPDGRTYEADKDIPIRPLKQTVPPGEKMPNISVTPETGPVIPTPAASMMLPRPSIYDEGDRKPGGGGE